MYHGSRVIRLVTRTYDEPLTSAVTKGDNNPQDDISLYRGLKFLRRSNMYVLTHRGGS